MDCVFSWIMVACGVWYGGYRFLIAVVKADEERKARNRVEWDEMW